MMMQQFLRFSVIGVFGFLVDASILALCVSVLDMNLYIGRLVSFLAAVTTTWALNRRFTFQHLRSPSQVAEWLRFLLFNAFGGLVNLGAYAWTVHEFLFVASHPSIGVACGSVAGLFVNFALTKIFVFRTAPMS